MTPQRFRKKPVVVTAVQYLGVPVVGICDDMVCRDSHSLEYPAHVHTLEGELFVAYGDWIVCGIKGEYYPVKPDIFAATYEPVKGSMTTPLAKE